MSLWYIFNLTVYYDEKYSREEQQLAFKGWCHMNKQEELLTGEEGEEVEMVELKDHQQ